jgi:hypothetical protein
MGEIRALESGSGLSNGSSGDGAQGDVRVGHSAQVSSSERKWPPVPTDAQSSPLALAPLQESSSLDFTFIETVNGTIAQPVRWDPCRPIHLVVNLADAPPGADELLREAVARVSAATGLTFAIEGTTDEPPGGHPRIDTARYGNRWAPVLVAWTDPSAEPGLAGNVVGLGGPEEAPYVERSDRHYVTGIVYLDGPTFKQILKHGPGGHAEALAIVMHEFGHLVGLAHVNARSELMYAENIGQTTFGEGDLEGLRRLGGGPCFSK